MNFKEVFTIHNDPESFQPKHSKPESSKPRHARPRNLKRKIKRIFVKTVLVVELISVILACYSIYRLSRHNLAVRDFGMACSAFAAGASDRMDDQAKLQVKTYMESVSEELFEYVWTTEKVEYRTGADMSYESAGTLDEDKMVRRTGITHSGWSRIVVDDKEYYLPANELSADIPESLPIEAGIKGEYQKYALSLLPDFGWDSSEIEPLIYLWNRESGWNPNSHNGGSGAHGIPQALPASKMASEGSDYMTNPEPQIRWGLKYIAGRYGSPSNAWAHFSANGWY